MADKEEKNVSESDLIKAFESFWISDGDRLPVSEWKNQTTPDAKTVVNFLKSKREPGPNLRNNNSYNKCKDKWDKSSEKAAGEDEEFQHDEDRVNWNAIKSPMGIVWFINIRNWPMWMLSEANKHTRGYVLQTIESHPVKGVSLIMDKAAKRLGEIQKEKEEADKEKQEKKEAKKAKEEQEKQDPEDKKRDVFYVYAKKVAKNAADKMRADNESAYRKNNRELEQENKIEAAVVVTQAADVNKDINELE